jgi:putative methionine-R-sulfoxide reductase with GAF domain
VKAADSAEKLRRLQAVTDAALSSLDLDDLLDELLERTRELLSVDTAAILLVDPSGRELVATAASGLEEEVRQGIRVPVGKGFTGRIAARGEPLTIDHVDQETVYSQILIDKHLAAMTGVPMLAGSRLLGVLHIGSLTPRRFTDDDVDLLRLVADRASMATEARLSRLDRATTLALQRSLLPAHPADVDGLQIAVRYVPGAQVGIGGDWYDVFELPSGTVGVVIGDVAGSGLRAAVVMGRIRSALRAYALETDDPADVLARLDRKIQRFEPEAIATVLYAVIDPDRSRVTVSSAGHLPPVMIDGAGGRTLDIRPDLPLGVDAEAPRRTTVVELPAGDGLLLYTDGLIERRGQRLLESIDRMVGIVGGGTPDQICNRLLGLLRDQDASDDAAILALVRSDTQ